MATAVVALKIQGQHEEEDKDRTTMREYVNEDDERLAGIPKHLRHAFMEVSRLRDLMDKANRDAFKEFILEDIEDLVEALGPEADGSISLYLIRMWLMTQLADACSEGEVDILFGPFEDKFPGQSLEHMSVSIQDLFEVLTTGEALEKFLRDRKMKRGLGTEVTRDEFAKRIIQVTDRNDALLTLPVTVIFMGLFVMLVMGHLRVYNRQLLENSIEEYMNGRSPFGKADDEIDDLASWWEWVLGHGTDGPFGTVKKSVTTGHPYCLLASRNILIGDVKLSAITFDGEERSQWLLHSEKGRAALDAADPKSRHRYREAARVAAADLHENRGWNSSDIEFAKLSFMTYNEFAMMFGITQVVIPLFSSGAVVHRINTDAVASNPYPERVWLISTDVAFFLLVFWNFIVESRAACAALRLSVGELCDYLQFWNLVDWANILFSFATGWIWFTVCASMRDKNLDALLDDNYTLKVDVNLLAEAELNTIWESLGYLRDSYTVLQWMLACSTGSCVLKFFKAFSSNPRLMVVTNTFKVAGTDLLHFAIIFSTIFLPFMLIAHILFGSDITEFASVVSSINTGLFLVMGEFEWYYDISPRYFSDPLPSGMPKIYLALWYYIFMFFLLLVLLNMLLAIVIEHYSFITKSLKHEVEIPTIWQQVFQYWDFKKETKGFTSLEDLRARLENDENPAHKGNEVTVESLLDSFPEMTRDQAEWLFRWVSDYMVASQAAKAKTKLQVLEELASGNSDKLFTILEAVKISTVQLDLMVNEAKSDEEDDTESRNKKKIGTLHDAVQSLLSNIGKVRRDQDRLQRRIQVLAASCSLDREGILKKQATKGGLPSHGSDPPKPPAGANRLKVRTAV